MLKQAALKILKIKSFRFNSTYSTNRLASVPFKLHSLSLNNVKWDISSHCELFVKSQTNLQELKLKSIHQWLPPHEQNYRLLTDTFRHFFIRNQQLTKFTFDSMFYQDSKNIELLPDIVNQNITQLSYVNRDNNTNVFETFTRIFPSVKMLSFKDLFSSDASRSLQYLRRFHGLESLNLTVAPKSLPNLIVTSESLREFKYCATNEGKSAIFLMEFLAKNRKISDLSLNIEPITFEEISEIIMSLSSSLKMLTFSDLYLNPTEAELLVQNFPRLRKVRSDIQLKPEIVSILAASNIKFEKYENETLYEKN